MNYFGRGLSLWLSIGTLCAVTMGGRLDAASEEAKLTGCLTPKGKLKKLELGDDPRKSCNNKQTVIMLPTTTETTAQLICRSRFAGTYLTRIENSQGEFASRSIVTMYQDGNLSVTDSAEFAAMFGQQQGSYRCAGTDSARAITLDFGFSDSVASEAIVRSDWLVDMTSEGAIEGEITVDFYRPLETCNPLVEPGQCEIVPLGAFTFTSVRVVPPDP